MRVGIRRHDEKKEVGEISDGLASKGGRENKDKGILTD